MDDFRLWFKRETDTFKSTFSTAVDCYHDLVLSQMEPITGFSGNEATQERSQLIRQIANTKTIYEQHLAWLSRRYFKAKPILPALPTTIHDSIMLIQQLNHSTFVISPIITSQTSQVNTFADYSTTYQQQANGIPFSDFHRIDHSPLDSQFVSESSSCNSIGYPITNSSSTLDEQSNGSPATLSFSSAASEVSSEIQTNVQSEIQTEQASMSVNHCGTVPFKYVCNFAGCSMCFLDKTDLTRHQLKHNIIVNKERPFACGQCLQAFTFKSALTCHERIHAAFKPYICTWPECNYSAKQRGNVHRHVRTVHFGLPKTVKEQVERQIIDTRDAREFTEKIIVSLGTSEATSEQTSVSQSGVDSDFTNEANSVPFIEVKCELECAPDCEVHIEEDIPSISESVHETEQGRTQVDSVLFSSESGNSTVTASSSDNVLINNEIDLQTESESVSVTEGDIDFELSGRVRVNEMVDTQDIEDSLVSLLSEQVNGAQVEQTHAQQQDQSPAGTSLCSVVTPIITSGTATSSTEWTFVIEQVDISHDNNVEEQVDSHSMMSFNDEAADGDASDAETIIEEEFVDEATEDEPVPANLTVDFVPLPSTLTGRRRSTRARKEVNYAEATEDFSVRGNATGLDREKRPKDLSGKSSASKRVRVEPVVATAEAVSLSVIVQHLNCPETGCKKVCQNKAQLNEHLLVEHQIEAFRCKLKDCAISFATQAQLNDHRKSAHSKQKRWPCALCETICRNYQELCIHFLAYHEEGQFACSADGCNFTEKTRTKVKNHQLKHRTGKYRCNFPGCTSSFYGKFDFTRHLRVHSQERPFACGHCSKAFTQKCALTVHERQHSGLKPYRCKWPHCDFASADRSNVHSHVRLVHFGLPATKKKQGQRGIIDNRDARQFIDAV